MTRGLMNPPLQGLRFLLFLALLLPAVASAETEVVHRSGECVTSNAVWSTTEHWIVGPDGQRELFCSMGVSCNGRAWNTCGGRIIGGGAPNYEGLPLRPYDDAARGDTIRMRLGDEANHLTGLVTGAGEIRVTSDRDVIYRVFSLTTGVTIVEDLTPVAAGTERAIPLPAALPAGPYMVIAYDPAIGISLGYRAFMK